MSKKSNKRTVYFAVSQKGQLQFDTLEHAIDYVEKFKANFGELEIQFVKATFETIKI